MNFRLTSDYRPKGDQEQAIAKLVNSVKAGNRHQTLLGVTGESHRASPSETDVDVLTEAYTGDLEEIMTPRQQQREAALATMEAGQPEREAALVAALTSAGASPAVAAAIAKEQAVAEQEGARERVQLDKRIDDEATRLMALAKAQFDAAMAAVAAKEEAALKLRGK